MEKNYENGNGLLPQFFNREMGFSTPKIFSRRISASQNVIKQFDLYGKLNGHEGCVNTIEFNSTGELLVSGSDDRQVKLWNWQAKELKFSYMSGHLDNIFQARIMPFTNDSKIVTSSADCQVRLGLLSDNGSVETKRLSKHQGRVHKLAVEPGSPYIFYSCGEDGFVQHYDLRSNSGTKLFYCSSISDNNQSPSNIGLNSIVIDPRNPNYFATGGSDVYVRVYDIRMYQINSSTKAGSPVNTFCARHFVRTDGVHITALAYSNTSELLVSYSDEHIYLFQKNMCLGPNPMSLSFEELHNLEDAQVYSGHRNSQTVKGVNFFGPNDDYILSGSDCGHIFIWNKKSGEIVRIMLGDTDIVNQLEAHPLIPVLASCGIENNVKIWAPSSNVVSSLPDNACEIMEANKQGRENHSRGIMHVLRLHRRQVHVYIERSYNGEDIESDEDEDSVFGFEDDEGENSRDCNIS